MDNKDYAVNEPVPNDEPIVPEHIVCTADKVIHEHTEMIATISSFKTDLRMAAFRPVSTITIKSNNCTQSITLDLSASLHDGLQRVLTEEIHKHLDLVESNEEYLWNNTR